MAAICDVAQRYGLAVGSFANRLYEPATYELQDGVPFEAREGVLCILVPFFENDISIAISLDDSSVAKAVEWRASHGLLMHGMDIICTREVRFFFIVLPIEVEGSDPSNAVRQESTSQ